MTGPGRPPVGPKIEVRLDPDLITFLNYVAEERDTTRSDFARELLTAAATEEGYYPGWQPYPGYSPDAGLDGA